METVLGQSLPKTRSQGREGVLTRSRFCLAPSVSARAPSPLKRKPSWPSLYYENRPVPVVTPTSSKKTTGGREGALMPRYPEWSCGRGCDGSAMEEEAWTFGEASGSSRE
eukprot:CAMPEP_0114565422 /NCGR_PEP_ID=MMETSP0114-20121206/14297_1 /TAXON_ID=31324 /ORGANISM="Goniomonas sp, Strain m" /LENGTH=109 /DNA_ID=CAMNT_0001751659 /DNA_START=205 /DNA_END=535 /DNA_ORIENTATION=-